MDGKQLTATVWCHAPSRYGGTALLVLLKLAGLSAKGGYSYASVGYLAAACGATPRAVNQVLKTLRKDGVVRVKHRKGHSSHIAVNWEAMQALPLALPKEAATESQDTAEPAKHTGDAQNIAERLKSSFTDLNLHVPGDWEQTWPSEFQKLLDAGHTTDAIRGVARFALRVDRYREELAERGPAILVEKFAKMLEQSEIFSAKDVAA
jgi:Helix-turn-helix domain